MKNYRSRTTQNLALTKLLQKFMKMSTPLGFYSFVYKFLCSLVTFLIALQWKCENLRGEKKAKIHPNGHTPGPYTNLNTILDYVVGLFLKIFRKSR